MNYLFGHFEKPELEFPETTRSLFEKKILSLKSINKNINRTYEYEDAYAQNLWVSWCEALNAVKNGEIKLD